MPLFVKDNSIRSDYAVSSKTAGRHIVYECDYLTLIFKSRIIDCVKYSGTKATPLNDVQLILLLLLFALSLIESRSYCVSLSEVPLNAMFGFCLST